MIKINKKNQTKKKKSRKNKILKLVPVENQHSHLPKLKPSKDVDF